jgi:class 3 adenylate cyclase
MSLLLSATSFALIVEVFSQEIGLAIGGYGGYVLKYVGDAVIAVFPSEFDTYKACENAINCARDILYIIKQCMNPAFKVYGLPELTVKIGVDYGDALVVLYGKSLQNAHIDLISSSMGITAKVASFAQPNEIVVGQSIYNIFLSSDRLLKACFVNSGLKNEI